MRPRPLVMRPSMLALALATGLAATWAAGCGEVSRQSAGSVEVSAAGPPEEATPALVNKLKGSRKVQIKGGRADVKTFEP